MFQDYPYNDLESIRVGNEITISFPNSELYRREDPKFKFTLPPYSLDRGSRLQIRTLGFEVDRNTGLFLVMLRNSPEYKGPIISSIFDLFYKIVKEKSELFENFCFIDGEFLAHPDNGDILGNRPLEFFAWGHDGRINFEAYRNNFMIAALFSKSLFPLMVQHGLWNGIFNFQEKSLTLDPIILNADEDFTYALLERASQSVNFPKDKEEDNRKKRRKHRKPGRKHH